MPQQNQIPPPPGGGTPVPNPHYQAQIPPPPSGGQAVPNPHYIGPNNVDTNPNESLGVRLTVQALRNSPASSVPLNIPESALHGPLSPDLEDRTSTPYDTTPPLLDRVKGGWNTFVEKAKAAEQAIVSNNK